MSRGVLDRCQDQKGRFRCHRFSLLQAECRPFPSEDDDRCCESIVGRSRAQFGLVGLQMGNRGAAIVAESAMMSARKRVAAVVLVQEEMSGTGEMRDRQPCV